MKDIKLLDTMLKILKRAEKFCLKAEADKL